jgi:large subunit ribosomal protein L15
MDISKAKAQGHRRAPRKRVGRGVGTGHGKTSGRGHKGAHSRSGWSSRGLTGGGVPPWRRLPKGGFSNQPFKVEYSVVNVEQLNRFAEGGLVTPDELRREGIVKQVADGGVKILGDGTLTRALTVRANAFSKSAVEKIQAAGGAVELIPGPARPVRNKAGSRTTGPRAATAK